GVPLVAAQQLLTPPAQQAQGARAAAGLVAEVVRPAAVGVDAVEVTQQAPRQQQRGDREVLVMGAGQVRTVNVRLRRGHQRCDAAGAVTGQLGCEAVLHGEDYKASRRTLQRRLSAGLALLFPLTLVPADLSSSATGIAQPGTSTS